MKTGIIHIFPACLFFILSCSNSDEKKCAKLKSGEFYYKGKIPRTGNIIYRNDSIQIVTEEQTGEKQKEKIVWTGPCSYELYPAPDSKEDILKSDLFPIRVSILEVTNRYYTVNVLSVNHKTEFNDTVWIAR